MSLQELRNKATASKQVAEANRPKTLAEVISADNMKAQFAKALPQHMTPERFSRVALTEMRKNPMLMNADQGSFMGALMQCAQLGLEPGSALGHAYLLPFNNKNKGIVEVQFILGYKGMIDLARRSGQIVSIEARAVYEADTFDVRFGLKPDLVHEPAWEQADRGELRAVYAVAQLKGGGVQFEVMGRAEIERIRDESQGYKAACYTARKYNKPINSPWATHFDEMAKKTVIRRLFKYLPVSIEYQEAIEREDRDDRRVVVDMDDLPVPQAPQVPPEEVDMETGEVIDVEAKAPPATDPNSQPEQPSE